MRTLMFYCMIVDCHVTSMELWECAISRRVHQESTIRHISTAMQHPFRRDGPLFGQIFASGMMTANCIFSFDVAKPPTACHIQLPIIAMY